MKLLEEQLWDYIDGLCTAEEAHAIQLRLLNEPETAQLYQQILSLSKGLQTLEPDQPSLSFSRNVMAQIAMEPAPITLRTHINKTIVYLVGAILVLLPLACLIYAFQTGTAGTDNINLPSLPTIPSDRLLSSTALKIFVLTDIVLGLLYIDSLLRKKIKDTKKAAF